MLVYGQSSDNVELVAMLVRSVIERSRSITVMQNLEHGQMNWHDVGEPSFETLRGVRHHGTPGTIPSPPLSTHFPLVFCFCFHFTASTSRNTASEHLPIIQSVKMTTLAAKRALHHCVSIRLRGTRRDLSALLYKQRQRWRSTRSAHGEMGTP